MVVRWGVGFWRSELVEVVHLSSNRQVVNAMLGVFSTTKRQGKRTTEVR